jgi:hypothetical protein
VAVEVQLMRARYAVLAAAALLALASAASAQTPAPGAAQQIVPDARTEVLVRQAKAIGFDLVETSQNGRYRNAIGVGGRTQSFVRRLDSLTYLATDDRYRPDGPLGTFAGSDEDLVARSRRVLAVLSVPAAEIARVTIEREYEQVASSEAVRGGAQPEPQRLVNRIASFQRSVGGVPVFSSYARVGLTKTNGVGMLRVHWPAIDAATLERARALQRRVAGGFTPPAIRGARPETVAAGIVHSPAAGEVMQLAAVIRVVYRPTDPRYGKKPVILYDANGRVVAPPSAFLKPPAGAETDQRRPTKSAPNPQPTG